MRAAGRGGSADRRLHKPGGPALRLAGAVILLVLAALGSAARGVTRFSTTGMLAGGAEPASFIAGTVFVAAACLVLAGVLVLLIGRRRRRPEDEFARVLEPVGPWWVRALVMLAALALIALPVAALVVASRGRRGGQRAAPLAPLVPVMPRPAGAAASPGQAGGAFLLGAVAALLAAAVLVVTALWLRHRRRARAAPHDRAAAPSPLADAVAAGTAALGATAGAREAIIACYSAMEASLATAGSPRRAADTPEELLSRAEGDGIIRTPAARRLTALFREARFSPHELADDQRQAALAALGDIADDLAGRS
jgi:predicted outer membrane lipoprotein